MLQERPKKQKPEIENPSKMRVFWRTQGECWRRMVTPFLMYTFMSMVAVVCQAIDQENTAWYEVVLGVVCILCGAAFNAHLSYHYGIQHYDNYAAGELHRENERLGLSTGGYRVDREYRVWKGFLIGFCVAVPMLVLALICYFAPQMELLFLFAAGWAYLPFSWAKTLGSASVSVLWSMLVGVLPVIVSGVFYIIGAIAERNKKAAQEARMRAVEEAREQHLEAPVPVREQTEEQRRKTLQSKKKKR